MFHDFLVLVGYSYGWAWGVAIVSAVLECTCMVVMGCAKPQIFTEETDENSALINHS